MRSFILASLAALAMAEDHWAVLVAGSNMYYNYRHQADVHHAYQILKNNGVPESNIILMSYDDIARSGSNPYPGQIFNKPDGENVYFQDDISYSGRDVTAEKFLAVLKGDEATAGGPVLKSTAESKVFVYFADHGAPGFVAFPSGGYLYATALQEAIDYMETNQMYDEMVIYIEACESGSMFPSLRADQRVYAMTAANASESSWGTYCGSEAMVGGKNVGSCLGDLFSVNWMEDTEANNPQTETLDTQHTNVKNTTTKSHVQVFGDLSFLSEPIADFEGGLDSVEEVSTDSKHWKKLRHFGKKFMKKVDRATAFVKEVLDGDLKERSSLDSRDIKMHYLYDKYNRTGSKMDLEELQAELEHRHKVDALFAKLTPGLQMQQEVVVDDYDCYSFLINSYEATCERFSDYSLKYAKAMAHICSTGEDKLVARAIQLMQEHCLN